MSKPDVVKQLQIKTSSLKRMMKDLEMYKKEEEEFKEKIENMKNDGKSFHDIQQQEKCLHETLLVYRDVLKRLSLGYSDLHKHLKENFDENYSKLSNSSENNSNLDMDDPKNQLISSAFVEMKKVRSEYGNIIKLEELSLGNNIKNDLISNDTDFV
ncbi:tubulin binding cofactor family protein [Cryptosporidium ubiquitum]|uniref:Tubulin-specific chaperone A n=1 Tax=Cryptosporidium ubiquitum TaxID=857276 RepID=A0A1J4MKP4_9CRYT|nr:tubulin binding cofactor family protein [Cryptosporidium ubiquitum]OII74776.1 tubulin binding cofactor family protein [Cryptosporidium ubiquitum]